MAMGGNNREWLIIGLLLTLASAALQAQSLGAISGTTRDESGALLRGVTIRVSSTALQGEERTVTTNSFGTYYLPALPAGRYRIEAALPGFENQIQQGVRVAVNQEVTVDFSLRIANISATVEVSANPPLIERTRSDLNARILGNAMDGLPLNGRNFEDLIALVPGAKAQPEGDRGTELSIFGERGAAISYIVDGADNNDPLEGGAFQRFTPDSIQEFEVITTGYDAQLGRAQGGVVNAVTRSGGNRWFGSGYLFARNDVLDSSNVAGQKVPRLERSQWGGTLGGPIRKNAAFFFGSFERLDEARGLNIDRSKIPSFVLDGLGTPSGIEDFATGPKTDGTTGLFKLDFHVSDSNRLDVLFNHTSDEISGEISSPVAGTTALPSAARLEERKSNSLTVRDVWNLTPRSFLETTGKFIVGQSGLNRNRQDRLEPILHLLRSGFLQTNAPFGGKEARDVARLQIAQTASHYRSGSGSDHLIKFGWDWSRVGLDGSREITNDVEYSAAFLNPNQAEIMRDLFQRFGFEQAAARFFTLSGNPDGSLDLDTANHDLGLFIQDDWRLRRSFTLNLGLRYDYASLFWEDKNNFAPRLGFAWDAGAAHKTVIRGSFGLFFDRNLLSMAATVPELGGVFTRSAFDVALPRLGYAYTDSLIDLVITSGFPLPDGGRTPVENPAYQTFADLLRQDPLALYRLLGVPVTDPRNPPVINADNIENLSGLSPEETVGLLESTFAGTDWAFWDVAGGSIVGNRVLSFFPRGPLDRTREISRFSKARTPWTRAFNLGVEHQLGGDLALSAGYVHRRSRDLLTRRISNLFDVPPGHPNFGKTTDSGPRVNQVTYEGRIDYDGVVFQLRRRFTRWYSLDLSYMLAHARDNLLTGRVGSGFTNNNHPELDYGPSNQSVPHVFVAHTLVHFPWDVRISAISFWRSGDAFNPRGIVDQDGDGLVDQRDVGTPRNSFRTRPYFNLDLRVEKKFRITEDQRVGLLVEAFNLSNRANVEGVNAVSGPSFGVPNRFFPGRELQIGIRFDFGP